MPNDNGQLQDHENEKERESEQSKDKSQAEEATKENKKESEDSKSDSDGGAPEKEGRFKGLKKFAGKTFKTAKKGAKKVGDDLVESDEELKKIKDASSKIKKETKRAAKVAKRGFKFLAWCISNPLGWIVGIICIWMLASVTSGLTDSMKKAAERGDFDSLSAPTPDDLGDDEKESVENESDSNTDGQKTTIILMDCGKKDKASGAATNTSSEGASDMDWTKEGTTAYNNAKALFDTWTNEGGLSGEAAAGIVGWVQSEGGTGIIGRAEGHYGASLEENSIKYGVVPIPSGNYAVGGGGIYQFTPYTVYGQLKEDKWEDGKAMTDWVMRNRLPNDWIPQAQGIMHDMTGTPHTFEEFAQETDPGQATLMWNSYERGDQSVIPRDKKIADAKKANEIFNKKKIKFDKAKFEKTFKRSAGEKGSGGSSAEGKIVKCKETSEGSNGWQGKGGTHNYHDHQAWKPENLPADLKQYAIDPASMGMEYHGNWACNPSSIWNQCTDLSASLMHVLWEKDGKHPTQLRGDGWHVADNWAATYGGKTTRTPTSGAVFSTSTYNHTGVVSHVFEDDSILIIEQNYTNSGAGSSSGQAGGDYKSWNYRIVSKAAQEAEGYKFYNPGDNGFTVNKAAKSLA